MKNLIEIIDLGVCNVVSISNLLESLGYETKIVQRPSDLHTGKKMILPGVGAFEPAAIKLDELGWLKHLQSQENNYSLLGICIGMHLLGSGSEEGPGQGLGLINATAKLIKTNLEPVPHMGWEELDLLDPSFSLLEKEASKFYFSHSYFMQCKYKEDIKATFKYGGQIFPAIISKGSIMGIQFHPEKSHRYGAQLLRNFVELDV